MCFTETRVMQRLIFVGPIPPPVHGQAVTTKFLYECIVNRGYDVLLVNTAERNGSNFFTQKLNRILNFIYACFVIVFHRLKDGSNVYISVSANKGMYITVILVCLA